VPQPGRNDPCPCGSGKKFKKCCMANQAQAADHPPPPGGYYADIDLVSNQVPRLIREGRLEEAEAVCRRLLEEFPDQLDGRERLAELEEARGNWQRAAERYRAVARLHLEADPEQGAEPAAYYLDRARAMEARSRSAGIQGADPSAGS
jgi:tetratricopeptide (TPR) repeat protein